jgi:hypothetical protein
MSRRCAPRAQFPSAGRADSHGGLAGEKGLSGNAQLGLGIALGTNIQMDDSWRSFGLANSDSAKRETEVNARQNRV